MLKPVLSLSLSLVIFSLKTNAEVTCSGLMGQNLSPQTEAIEVDREYESLLSMVESGQESYALQILEEKLENSTITEPQAFLLTRIYREQRRPLDETKVLIYLIEVLGKSTLEVYISLIHATERYIEQNPEERSKLPTMISAIRDKFENLRQFFLFSTKVLVRNQFYAEAENYALRTYELSNTLGEKRIALKLKSMIAAGLNLEEEVYKIDLLSNQNYPGNTRTLYHLAYYTFWTLKNFDEALDLVQSIFDYRAPDFYKMRAYALEIRILLRMGRNDDALRRSSTAKAEFPENSVILNLYEQALDRTAYD